MHLLQVGPQIQVMLWGEVELCLEQVCQPPAEYKLGQGKGEDWESCKASISIYQGGKKCKI